MQAASADSTSLIDRAQIAVDLIRENILKLPKQWPLIGGAMFSSTIDYVDKPIGDRQKILKDSFGIPTTDYEAFRSDIIKALAYLLCEPSNGSAVRPNRGSEAVAGDLLRLGKATTLEDAYAAACLFISLARAELVVRKHLDPDPLGETPDSQTAVLDLVEAHGAFLVETVRLPWRHAVPGSDSTRLKGLWHLFFRPGPFSLVEWAWPLYHWDRRGRRYRGFDTSKVAEYALWIYLLEDVRDDLPTEGNSTLTIDSLLEPLSIFAWLISSELGLSIPKGSQERCEEIAHSRAETRINKAGASSADYYETYHLQNRMWLEILDRYVGETYCWTGVKLDRYDT